LGRESDHSPQSTAEVKNAWNYTSTPQYALIAWGLVQSTGTASHFTYINSCRDKLFFLKSVQYKP